MNQPPNKTTLKKLAPIAVPSWPSFAGTSQFVGTSASGAVSVYVDPSLAGPGMQNANDLLADADRVVAANNAVFGTPGGQVSIIVVAMDGNTDGTGGADHNGCDYTTGNAIEVCASFGNSPRVSALFEAELSECSMGGNLCGCNTGEALSRWCAAVIGSNALSDFATAPTWVADGMPDYVNQTDPSDQNPDSTGCGMAFISWLMGLGYSLNAIAPAMVSLLDAGTFAQLYGNLTGNAPGDAFAKFTAAVKALPNGVTTDDPFGGVTKPAQMGHLTPVTVELAGKIFSSILADMAAGKEPHQIAAGVRAVMACAPNTHAKLAARGGCGCTSRRLRPPN